MHYTATVQIDTALIANTMCAGIEGGIAYWCKSFRPVQGQRVQSDHGHGDPWYLQTAFWESDFRVKVTELDYSHESNLSGVWEFGPGELKAALNALAQGGWESAKGWEELPSGPRHLQDLLEGNEDAETGNVLIQLCVFGEVVYG